MFGIQFLGLLAINNKLFDFSLFFCSFDFDVPDILKQFRISFLLVSCFSLVFLFQFTFF